MQRRKFLVLTVECLRLAEVALLCCRLHLFPHLAPLPPLERCRAFLVFLAAMLMMTEQYVARVSKERDEKYDVGNRDRYAHRGI